MASVRGPACVTWPRSSLAVLSIAMALTGGALPAEAQDQKWIQEIGTVKLDETWAAAPDGAGGVFAAGTTVGDLVGPQQGKGDVWLARFDGTGSQHWLLQLGTSEADFLKGAASDGAGGVFVCGYTYGSLGGPITAPADAWLARYDSAGNQLWLRQSGLGWDDQAHAASPDGTGGVFVVGYDVVDYIAWFDATVERFDSSGSLLWSRRLGTTGNELGRGAAPDGAGGVYLAGETSGSLGGPFAGGYYDVWLARYDGSGNQLWVRQLGTNEDDRARTVTPDGAGGVFVAGGTKGSLGGTHGNPGSWDEGWLARYDSAGNQLWIQQWFGGADVRATAPDGLGGVFVGGYGLLRHLDGAGSLLWEQPPPPEHVVLSATHTDTFGLYVGGGQGTIAGHPHGGFDAWIARYEESCDTPSVYCTAKINSLGCTPSISYTGGPSASHATSFRIWGSDVISNSFGLLIYSKSGADAKPFQGGWLCLKPTILRTALLNSGGNPPPSDCSGTFVFEFNDYIASGIDPALTLGRQVWAQYWYRDAGSPSGTGFSDALTFEICP